jgi:hypothetical protein
MVGIKYFIDYCNLAIFRYWPFDNCWIESRAFICLVHWHNVVKWFLLLSAAACIAKKLFTSF